MDRTPKCIMETNEKYGTAALHIYFIDKPWDFKCPAVVAWSAEKFREFCYQSFWKVANKYNALNKLHIYIFAYVAC